MNWKEVWTYINLSVKKLSQEIPCNMYVYLFLTTILGIILIISFNAVKRKMIFIGAMLLFEYIIMMYCSTVFLRPFHETHELKFELFWSYNAFFEGKNYVMAEKIMNIVVFLPIGLLLGCTFCSLNWRKVLLFGCGISFSIEVLQFIFCKGCAELDDVMHNTLGCLLGYGMYKLARSWYERACKRSVVDR